MRALTEHQPFASLIEYEIKKWETRSWGAYYAVGERFAIHAGKTVTPKSELNEETEEAITKIYGVDWRVTIPKGVVVATATLRQCVRVYAHDGGLWDVERETVECVDIRDKSTLHVPVDPYGDFSVGRFLWLFDNVETYPHRTPVRGMQKIWEFTPEIIF